MISQNDPALESQGVCLFLHKHMQPGGRRGGLVARSSLVEANGSAQLLLMTLLQTKVACSEWNHIK